MTRIALCLLVICAQTVWAFAAPARSAEAAATVFERLNSADMDELVVGARAACFARERQAAADEIATGAGFDADRVAQAVEMLQKASAVSAGDNVRQITSAFEWVEPGVTSGVSDRLLIAGDAGYLDAARRLAVADALLADGKTAEAARMYADVVRSRGEILSFAAEAAVRGGRAYESIGRKLYAMELYQWWLDTYAYGVPTEARTVAAKVALIRQAYRQPLLTLADKAGLAADGLAAGDCGPAVRQVQRETLVMLDDLIATAEENADGSGGSSSSSSNSDSSDDPGDSGSEAAMGTPAVSGSPAQRSTAPAGKAAGPVESAVRTGRTDDSWGRLPIREREKLIETFRQRYPDRYSEMLDAYYRKLSETRP